MYIWIKKSFPYFLIFISCIAAYRISKSATENKIIEKEITYFSDTASEVYMVWGLMNGSLPEKNLWPPGSYIKDKLIWTKMSSNNSKFDIAIKLPVGTQFYYWMVQAKNLNNDETNIWDSGRPEKDYYTDSTSYGLILNPGYFIFLAGFIPLLLFYSRHRNDKPVWNNNNFVIKDYIPQFDSIRAIAVLLVIIHHWVPKNSILNFLPNGPLGVNIFFVLSGFLITGILLKAARQTEEYGIKKATVFKNFYIRRTLRIFPIYYLLLFVLWFLKDPSIYQDGIYYFTYISNYLFYSQQFFPGHVAHLWSLGVEEQFYLFWPWLIVLTKKEIQPYLIGLFVIIGISMNYFFLDKGWWISLTTPACFDAFALGGLLSWFIAYRQDLITRFQPVYWIFYLAVIALFILDIFQISLLPLRTTHSLLAITILYYCLFKRDQKIINIILDNAWLRKLGKISYGVYLYHLFIPELWLWINQKFNAWGFDLFFNSSIPVSIKPYWMFIQEFIFLILCCIVSWKVIEKPINNLKYKFENIKERERLVPKIKFVS